MVFGMNRLFTQGTCHLTRFIEGEVAGSVETMAARKELDGISGLMEGFQTDRAIGATRVVQTDMGVNTVHIDTDITLVAVNMILNPSYPTDATLVAVILALVLVIQENAEGTPIGAHNGLARFTDLLGVLDGLTGQAFDLLDRFSVHGMGFLGILLLLVFDKVMTEPTRKELVAARG